MRMLLFSLVALLAAPAFVPAGAQETLSGPVMSDTPSGVGDPAAVVCRAPQMLADGAPGPKVCMHNAVWLRLSLTGKDLAADGKSVFDRPTVDEPDGSGNPDAVTCRRPVALTASRTRHGPEVCLTNSRWASLGARHLRVTANGDIVSTISTSPASGPDGWPTMMVERSPAL